MPENVKEAEPLLAAGVIGLQCTLSPTPAPVGDAFPAINRKQLEEVIEKLEDGTVVAVRNPQDAHELLRSALVIKLYPNFSLMLNFL